MKYFIKILIIVFLLVQYNTASFAQEPERHMILKKLIEEKNLNLYYLGEAYGMDGWVIEKDGNVQYAYTTPEGGVVFGMQLGPDGLVETTKQVKSLQGKIKENKTALSGITAEIKENAEVALEEPVKSIAPVKVKAVNADSSKKSKSESFFDLTEKSHWVSVGDKKAPYIYVYINPACEHCQDYWNDISNAVDNGSIQVRLIPFGKVDVNRTAAAALLSINDPASAWKKYVAGDKRALSVSLANSEGYNKTDSNSDLWADWQLPSAPFTVYRSSEDNKIKVIAGRPDNTLLLLSEVMK